MSDTKTLAVRLDAELHARLTLIAKLSGRSATEIIRAGIESQLDAISKQPEIAVSAAKLQQELARDVEAQQAALAALVGTKPSKPAARKGTTASNS